jgi:hypothetical protein
MIERNKKKKKDLHVSAKMNHRHPPQCDAYACVIYVFPILLFLHHGYDAFYAISSSTFCPLSSASEVTLMRPRDEVLLEAVRPFTKIYTPALAPHSAYCVTRHCEDKIISSEARETSIPNQDRELRGQNGRIQQLPLQEEGRLFVAGACHRACAAWFLSCMRWNERSIWSRFLE